MSKIDISSREFIARLKQGDRDSFEHLYDYYAPNLYGVVKHIVPTTDLAEDVLQRSFVKIWRNIDKYDSDKGTFFTWMLNICRNLAIDEYRKIKRKREKMNQRDDEPVYKEEETTRINIDEEADYTDLRKAMADLPEEQRTVIENLYLNGMTQRELAEYKDIPLGTIKSRVRLAFKKLRGALKLLFFWM